MDEEQKKRLTVVLILIMVSSVFAGFVFQVRQFNVKVVIYYSQGAVYSNDARVSDNTTALEALSMVTGNVNVNNSVIQCINSLCNDDGNWTAFNAENYINPSDYIVKPGETIYFIYMTNKTEQGVSQEETANYEAIQRLLKLQ